MKKPKPVEYQVMEHDDDGGKPLSVGVVTLDAEGMLAVVSAASGRARFLRDIVQRCNAMAELHVAAPPPPEDEDEGAVYSRPVRRGEAEFQPALFDRLRRYYGLELNGA